MRFFCYVLVCFMVLAGPAQAVPTCYSPRQTEAEQALRIHSELMVIALTCMKQPGQSAIYDKYQSFTRKNQSMLSSYESDLITYFRIQGAGNPEKEFHSLRTRLANRISTIAVNSSTPSFCSAYAPRVDAALQMPPEKFQRWARQSWSDTPASRPQCVKI
jgi:hypothetical protein